MVRELGQYLTDFGAVEKNIRSCACPLFFPRLILFGSEEVKEWNIVRWANKLDVKIFAMQNNFDWRKDMAYMSQVLDTFSPSDADKPIAVRNAPSEALFHLKKVGHEMGQYLTDFDDFGIVEMYS